MKYETPTKSSFQEPETTSGSEPECQVQVNEKESLPSEYDGGYGWVCVIAQFLITANTWGVNGSFGIYLNHYLSTEAFPGTSEVAYAFVGGLSISQLTMAAPAVTYLSKTLGMRPTLFIGVFLEVGGLVAASFATQSWHLFLTQGLLFGWGCSFLWIGTYRIIPQWFTKRVGIAIGLASAGSGVGGLAHSLGSQAMITKLGLAWSFRITAICIAVCHVVCVLLMKDRNKDIQPHEHSFDIRMLKRPAFILILLWAYFSTIGYTIVLFSLPNNAIDIGTSSHQASIIGAMTNLGMAIGRPLIGHFGDRVGRVDMSGYATLLAGVLCLCFWTSANSFSTLLAFGILSGTVLGTIWSTIGPVLVDTFGTKELPATLSIALTLVSFPSAFAEAMGLALRRSRSPVYLNVQIFAGCMFLGGAICMGLVRFLPQIQHRLAIRAGV